MSVNEIKEQGRHKTNPVQERHPTQQHLYQQWHLLQHYLSANVARKCLSANKIRFFCVLFREISQAGLFGVEAMPKETDFFAYSRLQRLQYLVCTER